MASKLKLQELFFLNTQHHQLFKSRMIQRMMKFINYEDIFRMNHQAFRITSRETYEKQRRLIQYSNVTMGHEINTEALDER